MHSNLRPAAVLAFLTVLYVGSAAGTAQAGPADLLADSELVDLTHALGEDSLFWPTAERFHLEKVADGPTDKGYHYAANNFRSAEHGGTHLDAPVHFARGRRTVDQIALEQLVGPAVIVDVSAACAANPDHLVSTTDLESWEKTHGRLEPGTIVLIHTGYARRWPDAKSYLGTDERGPAAVAKLHFPGLSPAAAQWLADERRIKAVGLDTASIDYGQSTHFEAHRVLAEREIPIFENLANLDRLPARGAWLIALPTKIEAGSGAPLRAMAIRPRR